MKSITVASTLSFFLVACQPSSDSATNQSQAQSKATATAEPQASNQLASTAAADRVKLTLYKSPTCGCCQAWADKVDTSFAITTEATDDMLAIKQGFGVPAPMQSCHTSVSESGFVFEGHIPARIIAEFVANPPEGAVGLAVPGMPIGSPGMEVGDQFTPFTVYLLSADADPTPYREIKTKSDL